MRPITAAACSAAFSSAGKQVDAGGEHGLHRVGHLEVRRQLAQRPAAVLAPSTHMSISVATSSSTKNGLPSARSTMTSRTRGGQLDPEQLVEERPAPAGGSASSWSREPPRRPRPARPAVEQLGPCSREQEQRPVDLATSVSSRSQRSSSAQCTSSTKHDDRPLGDEPVEELDPRVVEPLARGQRVEVIGWCQARA